MAAPRAGIVIVANRGPNDFVWEDGAWVTRTATGGLVSMLTPLARRASVAWFCCVSEPPDAQQARQGLFTTAADQTDPRLHVVPVPVPAETYHAYYGQISNEVLWMLQHHVIGSGGFEFLDYARHQAWGRYLEANAHLAVAIARSGRPPRAFLIQDYHLYPLPDLLRATFPDTPILHFTHIPFPDPPVLRLIPERWRQTILRGMLGADIVGLQTPMDVRSFLSCCTEFLDVAVDTARCVVQMGDGREVRVRAYPASVDPPALRRSMRSPEVAAADARLAPERGEMTIIRVDRLDPSKNQQVGFLAFPGCSRCDPTCAAGCAFSRSWSLRGPTSACTARIETRSTARSKRSTNASRRHAASRLFRSTTPTTAIRRWPPWRAATCC